MEKGDRILIVDDDPGVRDALGDILGEVGKYQVDKASNGMEGLEKVKEDQFSTVLVDIRMPGMDGIEFLKRAKEHDSALPVVIITGFPTVDVAIQAMKEGASDFITKPFKYEQIEIVLRKLIRERQLQLDNTRLQKEVDHKRTIEILNEKLNEKVKQLSLINSIGDALSETALTGSSLFSKIVEMGAEMTGAGNSYLRVLQKTTTRWILKATQGVDGEHILGQTIPFEEMQKSLGKGFLPTHRCPPPIERGGAWPSLTVALRIRDEIFGALTVAEKREEKGFVEEDLLLLRILAEKSSLNIENDILYESVYHNLVSTLQSLVKAIEARDQYTHRHSEGVTRTAIAIARDMGCTHDELDSVRFAGMLHDIGKIGISDTILLKPDRLTDGEMEIVRTHPVKGEQILRPLGLFPLEESLIRHHHERWDGKGYPDGLRGDGIPFLARILAVADSFDAMASPRPYRGPLEWKEALAEIERCSGSQFDREVVRVFVKQFADRGAQ